MTPLSATRLGLATNIVLGAGKVAVGVFAGSQTLTADGLHSFSDLSTDIAVLFGIRISSRPPDGDHHFGHRRVSTLITLFIGSVLLLTAVFIGYRAIIDLGDPHMHGPGLLPFLVAALSILPKEALFWVTRNAGMEAGDRSVVANAWHHRTDAFTSVAAAAGLAGVAFGGPRWAFLDHLTAVVLSAFLAVTAIGFVKKSIKELVDTAPGDPTLESLEETLTDISGVRAYHKLRVRTAGGSIILDVHVLVDPDLDVSEAHRIATEVKYRLIECECDVIDAVVHIEPDDQQHRRGTEDA